MSDSSSGLIAIEDLHWFASQVLPLQSLLLDIMGAIHPLSLCQPLLLNTGRNLVGAKNFLSLVPCPATLHELRLVLASTVLLIDIGWGVPWKVLIFGRFLLVATPQEAVEKRHGPCDNTKPASARS
jgi:hypothetical protein